MSKLTFALCILALAVPVMIFAIRGVVRNGLARRYACTLWAWMVPIGRRVIAVALRYAVAAARFAFATRETNNATSRPPLNLTPAEARYVERIDLFFMLLLAFFSALLFQFASWVLFNEPPPKMMRCNTLSTLDTGTALGHLEQQLPHTSFAGIDAILLCWNAPPDVPDGIRVQPLRPSTATQPSQD